MRLSKMECFINNTVKVSAGSRANIKLLSHSPLRQAVRVRILVDFFFIFLYLLQYVPGIVAFIHKHIEPLIFFSSFSLCLNHLSWEFIKNLRPKPICRRVFLFPGMHFHFAGVLLCFPNCFFTS
jgi:hypothetical protein